MMLVGLRVCNSRERAGRGGEGGGGDDGSEGRGDSEAVIASFAPILLVLSCTPLGIRAASHASAGRHELSGVRGFRTHARTQLSTQRGTPALRIPAQLSTRS